MNSMKVAHKNKSNNILITGGAGFIGSHLVRTLYKRGYNITVLDNLSPQIHGTDPERTSQLFNSLPHAVKFIKGSITSKSDWIQAMQGQSVVAHLAAETGTGQSMYEIEKYTNVNVIGTSILLDILTNDRNHSITKILLPSSRSIYGEGKYYSKELGVVYPAHRNKADLLKGDFEVKAEGATTPLQLMDTDENSKLHPSSIYGINKLTQEQMVMTVCEALGVSCTALRLQNVYGPGQSLKNPYTGILSIFSSLIRTDQSLNIFEDGLESRDFVYISDVIWAMVLSIENDTDNVDVYNVGSGMAVNVIKVAETLCKYLNTNVPIEITGKFRIGDIRHNFADISKINKALGFEPKYNFEKGIELFTDWVKNQPIKDNNYRQSLYELTERGLFK